MDGITQGAAPLLRLAPPLRSALGYALLPLQGAAPTPALFVVADCAKGFRPAEIKRSVAPPLPIRAKLSGGPKGGKTARLRIGKVDGELSPLGAGGSALKGQQAHSPGQAA